MENQKVCVVAMVHAKEGHAKDVHAAIVDMLLDATRAEDGCIKYTLHQDTKDENTFVFYEIWQSAAHLERHAQSAHIQAYREKVKDMLVSSSIHTLHECAE